MKKKKKKRKDKKREKDWGNFIAIRTYLDRKNIS